METIYGFQSVVLALGAESVRKPDTKQRRALHAKSAKEQQARVLLKIMWSNYDFSCNAVEPSRERRSMFHDDMADRRGRCPLFQSRSEKLTTDRRFDSLDFNFLARIEQKDAEFLIPPLRFAVWPFAMIDDSDDHGDPQ